jgi:hypothetical protein
MYKKFPNHFDKRVKATDVQRWLLELETDSEPASLKNELRRMAVEGWLIDIACIPESVLLC